MANGHSLHARKYNGRWGLHIRSYVTYDGPDWSHVCDISVEMAEFLVKHKLAEDWMGKVQKRLDGDMDD